MSVLKARRMMTSEDWKRAGGVYCTECGSETVRLIKGLCLACWQRGEAEREEREGRKREKRALIRAFSQGRITLREMKEGHL